MAFVTAKPGGRYEIRETRRTPHGPRATTLVTFRTLGEEEIEQARERATGPVDEARLRAGARRVGALVVPGHADRLARSLLAALAAGSLPSPGLCRALADALEARGVRPGGELAGLADWIDAPDQARAETLGDLLELADAIPRATRRAEALAFPRLSSGVAGDDG
jgi:hypothetical protein